MNKENWNYLSISECADVIGGGTPSTKNLDYWNGKIPWISPKDLSNNKDKYIARGGRSITELGLEKSSAKLLPANSLLFTSRAPIGYLAINTVPVATNQGFKSLIFKDGFDVEFFYYLFKQNIPYIKSIASGSTFLEVSGSVVKKLSFLIPSKEEQKRISNIFSRLDKKIELNQKMNETLEEIAKTLFKSWFIDFEPVRAKAEGRPTGLSKEISDLFPDSFEDSELGEIPKGWEVAQLQKYVTVKRGGSPRPIHDFMSETGLPWVKISDASASDTRWIHFTKGFIKEEGLKKTVLLQKNELILSNSATPGIPRFLNLDACIHDGWLYFPKKKRFTDQYLYQLFLEIRPHLLNSVSGTVFTNLKTDILKQYQTTIPSPDLVSLFEEQAVLIHDRCRLLLQESATLSELIDTLLPKLISGELKIPDAENIIEEAGI